MRSKLFLVRLFLVVTFFTAAIGIKQTHADSDAYLIGAYDKLRITVSDWPPGGAEFKIRLDGTFAVNPSGYLSLPMIGDVHASGFTTQQIGKAVSEGFRQKLGAMLSPTTSVEIVEFRPIFTVGVVDKPGSYPYRPGMTVLHAVSMSGGFFRRRETDFPRLQRELVAALGDISLLKTNMDPLIGKKARLKAELDGKDTIEFPAELTSRQDDERIARIMSDERRLMEHRRETLKAGLDENARIIAAAEKQKSALVAQEQAQDQQIGNAKRELTDQSELVAKGLARRPVLFSIEQRVAEAEAKKRQLSSDQLRNAQEILKAEQASRELRTNRHTEIMSLISETETELMQLEQRIATANQLAKNAEMEMMKSGGEVLPVYAILRQQGGALQEQEAQESTEVRPGDIVRVTLLSREQVAQRVSLQSHDVPLARAASLPLPTAGEP